jgi:hypothetical protein
MAKPNIKRRSGAAKPQWELYNVRDNPEWQLAEGYAEEYTDITGIKITYYQRNNEIQPDVLYGETQDIEFLEGKETKILYEVGEIPTLYSMFGMMATDQIIAHIPQCIYSRDVSKTELPKPGDLIKVEWYRGDFIDDNDPDQRTFEISHVAQDQSIFQLRSLVYVMYLIPYRYSEESQSAKDASSDLDTTYVGISAYGDNNWIDTQSDILSAYTSVDTKLYGY